MRILIVDASPLIYATFHKVGHLSSSRGEPTGLRFGLVRTVKSYETKTKADLVVLAFDLPTKTNPILKAIGRQEYKSNREITPEKEKMFSQIPALRDLISLTKWTQVDAEGYEADDLIGAIARAKASRGNDIIIVTTDNDMMQLVRSNVRIFQPGKSARKGRPATKDGYVGPGEVRQIFGVWPEHLLFYRALAGDVSDNLGGISIKGLYLDDVREKLIQLPRDIPPMGLLELLKKRLDARNPVQNLIGSDLELFKSNLKIMNLETPPNMNVKKGSRDRAALTSLFRDLEFKSLMKSINELTGEPT